MSEHDPNYAAKISEMQRILALLDARLTRMEKQRENDLLMVRDVMTRIEEIRSAIQSLEIAVQGDASVTGLSAALKELEKEFHAGQATDRAERMRLHGRVQQNDHFRLKYKWVISGLSASLLSSLGAALYTFLSK